MLVLWAVHLGHSRQQAADLAAVGIATAKRYILAYRDGDLEGLVRCDRHIPTSELADHTEVIKASLTAQSAFLTDQLRPALDAAEAGTGHVFFVDAAYFVYGTFLCCLWSIARVCVRAASGRQRFNVLGAWNALTRQLVSVTNTTVVNTDTMCALLRALSGQNLVGPITVVLDNARYQRNKVVQALAAELNIRLLFLPSYSPNLNLIERLWGFVKRQSVYGKYHPDFASFRTAIETTLSGITTKHANALASLMTLDFQTFEDVSLLAA